MDSHVCKQWRPIHDLCALWGCACVMSGESKQRSPWSHYFCFSHINPGKVAIHSLFLDAGMASLIHCTHTHSDLVDKGALGTKLPAALCSWANHSSSMILHYKTRRFNNSYRTGLLRVLNENLYERLCKRQGEVRTLVTPIATWRWFFRCINMRVD